ncbi:MAG: response regulator transcription factor [Acidimicrobiales bacterium]
MTSPTPLRPVRVVVVDDHPLIRSGIASLLDSVDDLELAGEAGDAPSALAIVAADPPDVVIMDLELDEGGIGGVAATRLLRERHPDVAVLVLTMTDDDATLAEAIDAGASGYLLKASSSDQLPNAIRTVASGGSVFGPRLAERLLRWQSNTRSTPFPQLTTREREVLAMAARGDTNPAIARALQISPRTVANHVSNILMKLPAIDRIDAVLQARAAGLVER